MNRSSPTPRRPDRFSLEMIVVVGLTTFHDFLLSDALSLPLALQHSAQAQLRSLDRVASGAEIVVPAVVLAVMLILWLARRDGWVHRLAVAYLGWVTLRLVTKVALVLYIITSRPQARAGVLLRDTVVLWLVIFLLFGVWYWIIDAGGPRARREGAQGRVDFVFPQQAASLSGWTAWQPGLWDYVFLGFTGSTQFGLGDTAILSWRAKFLLMLQATLSVAVIVFIASIALSVIH
jgi:hypothetical protein